MEGYDSKIRKISRCSTAVSNETILATRQEFFFTKVAPVQNIADIVSLDFWLMLPSCMFISSCAAFLFFFEKKIYFFEGYISVNTIFECLPSGHPKYEQLRRGRGRAHLYVRLYTISFHGVSPLISSIILARKNSFSFKSNYIQALK